MFTNGLYNGLYDDMHVCTIFTNGLYEHIEAPRLMASTVDA